ncbi:MULTISPECIES: hypothetical protein [Bradyrhizobium]|jgi:hypothetical protein|uniref:hypothetical protein n=1 Tax=Bradyrhizobium TaxID=374 RepID=UPI001160024C|nr:MULTISPECIES: hypothetical protein [Bradyrhizobium]
MMVEPENAPGGASSASSLSAKAIGSGVRARNAAFLRRDLRCNFLDIVVKARIAAAVENARRWTAIGIFRIASLILRCAMNLHQQRRISHNGLRTVLSGTRVLERFGAWLVLDRRRKRQQDEQDFHSERHGGLSTHCKSRL